MKNNEVDEDKIEGIEYDITKRWENGINHHPKSEELMGIIQRMDWFYGDDYFCWKVGGDGDNGETLMFELDIYFEEQDKKHRKI